jgi:hypothetical protein
VTVQRRHLTAIVALTFALRAGVDAQRLPVADRTTLSAPDSAVSGDADSSPFENIEFFAGLDGSKQPQDLGINANMGVRFAVNAGIPLSSRAGLGAQLGLAVNLSDAAVHVLDQIDGTSRRSQTFLTIGLFQQGVSRLSWALGYDFLHESYYDTFTLGQLRGQAGYALATDDEAGVWFTRSLRGDTASVGSTAVRLDPITQVNGYLRHTWPMQARTTVWAGIATHHHRVVLVLPGDSRDDNVIVYGARLELPLSGRFSITGSGNFITPTATGTVDASLGLTYYPGRPKSTIRRSPFAPPMTVGNNPEFPVDLYRSPDSSAAR